MPPAYRNNPRRVDRLRTTLLAALACVLATTSANDQARAAPCSFEPQGEGRVAAVIDARSFRLEDGREIRLAGIEPISADAARRTAALSAVIGGRTAVAIRAPSPENAGAAFDQNRIGLHHLCFRARERADVDELHAFLASIGTKIIRAPREDQWAPGYYSMLFEDPDGIRLEINHVPGKGLLTER